MAIWKSDATDLSAQLANRSIDPVELLQVFKDRIARLNPKLNAIVCTSDEAEVQARESARRIASGERKSPIDGIPILIKDNLFVRGMPATWGSKLYKDRVCDADEIPVEKLRQAGAVIVGKTNVPEFTVEGFTDNRVFGCTPNPWKLDLTPGGSSGGSVAAVSAGLAPFSIGTDGGGSIRRPAAYTNLVGLKPSLGRIARGGGLPQLLLDMEVIGTITRSVRDQDLLFDVLAGQDIRDHTSMLFAPNTQPTNLLDAPKGLKILAVETFGDAPLDPEIRSSFRQMVDAMSDLGHQVTEGPLPLDIQELNDLWSSIGSISLGLLMQREPKMRELASEKYVGWADIPFDAAHLLNVFEVIQNVRNAASQAFAATDIIMTPTCAANPWPTKQDFPPEIDGQPVGPRGSAIYTGWVNACGHPAISVPGKVSVGGLPIGIQFVGGMGEDHLLLRLAQQIETLQGWLDQWPAVSDLEPRLNR